MVFPAASAGAQRLVAGEVERGLVDGNDRPFDFVRQPAKVVVPLGHVVELARHFAEELAVVFDLGAGQRVGVLGNEVAQPPHQHAPLGRMECRPITRGEGRVRGLHGAVHVLRFGLWNQAPRFGRVRIVAFEVFAGGSFDPLTTYEHLVLL